MQYEISGKVVKVGDTQSFGSNGFTKRELVLDVTDEGSKFQNFATLEFKKERCSLLDSIRAGQSVKVKFVIDGRTYQDKKTGDTRYFTTLTGLKVEANGGSVAVPEAPAAPAGGFGTDDMAADDMPF